MVETTLSYTQSTFSPLSVHIQSTWGSTYVATRSPRTWIHVDPMAFNVEGGNQGHGGESWGAPMPPEWGDPTVCRAWPGFGTTFSNLLNNVPPPAWTTWGSTEPIPVEGKRSGSGGL
jgi:hypothetical protein